MNLQFLSNRALAKLRDEIDVNQPAYLAGRAKTLVGGVPSELLESRIQVAEPPKLESPRDGDLFDAENVRRIYQWLRLLTPAQASDPRLWTFLTHGPYSDYTALRWPLDPASNVGDRIRERYFLEGEGLATLVRNSIARLWWFGHLTCKTDQPDPFALTDVLLSLQDIQMAFLERAIGRSQRILHGSLNLWRRLLAERANVPKQGPVVQQWAKLIRLHGGVVLLDALPDKQLQNLIWLKLGNALNEDFENLDEAA